METLSLNPETASADPKSNVPKKSEKEFFFKPRENPGSFFAPSILNSEPIQRKRNENLPADLQTNMETAFGHDFSGITIQRDSKEASSLNALAFTQGENIHFAPGQFDHSTEKGKNLIGHEFAHIVQQRNGMVKPTNILGKGLAFNNDSSLESEADQLGEKAVKGESIAKYQAASINTGGALSTIQAKSHVIQRAVATSGGTFDTDQYDLRRDMDNMGNPTPVASGVRGVDIKLKFTPNATVDADRIGLTQTAQSVSGTTHPFIDGDPSRQSRAITTGTEAGTMIDRADARNNPIYGSDPLAAGNGLDTTPMDNNTSGAPFNLGVNATYRLGFRHTVAGVITQQDAMLKDGPTLTGVQTDSSQIFESTALAIQGSQVGTYYGSVRWGWRTDAAGNFTKIPLAIVSQGVPSATFMRAATIWNGATDSTGAATANLPIVATHIVTGSSVTLSPPIPQLDIVLPVGTRVQVITPWHPPLLAGEVRVIDGPFTGRQGQVGYMDWDNLTAE